MKVLRSWLTLCGVALLLVACSPVPLYSNLGEQQANEVLAELLAAEVQATKVLSKDKKSWIVSVRQDQIPQAMQLLKRAGLPREQQQNLGEVFAPKGFVSSETEQKSRYMFALSQELEHTLAKIEDVLSARVHLAIPERDVVKGTTKPSSAAVVLFTREGAEVLARDTDIKAIVKDSIEGLDDINNVTVEFFVAGVDPMPLSATEPPRQVMMAGFQPLLLSALGSIVVLLVVFVTWLLRRRSPALAKPSDSGIE